ncbi:Crp/Fnr family transcriptional regulator [Desulfosarcina sp. OttesenSCG-928-A07]|nr:Crp/Fnr family transcriptional regulator [Desulfosarcina sp. OttesenSCG-928-G17]MDL2328998.1 Crp/Fnr family transcriptional regulator [Desulfosarcina sp. OttesenSCG-928-A07]
MGNDIDLEQAFPFIAGLDPGLRQAFNNAYRLKSIKQGHQLSDSGTSCQFMMFVLAGCIKIFKLSPEGREITLFRVTPGECCIMSAACILSGKPFPAMAVAEEAVTAVALPGTTFIDLFSKSTVLRQYLMGMFADRFEAMAMLVEEVTFNRMDKRLAKFLIQNRRHGKVETTHEAIALEMGTAREVVSRLLNDFQKKGYVRLSRGELSIESPDALLGLCES